MTSFFSDNADYYTSLGKSIVETAKVVPDGLLIFFKSYSMMEKCENLWRNGTIWENIERQKPIFIEPRDKHQLKSTTQAYKTSITQKKGAIFMALLRGKVSEGVDFADIYGRGVVIIGIPYASLDDPKIELKKRCLDQNRTAQNELLAGDEWYRLDAVRAVNQAIGRVIRHKDDFGAILFFDAGFNQTQIKKHLSTWLRKTIPNHSNYLIPFIGIIDELKTFFAAHAV